MGKAGKPSVRELEARISALEREREQWLQTRDALRESEENFSRLFESAPVPMAYATDEDGYRATIWNEAWYSTFGYGRDLAEGKSGQEIGLWVDEADRRRMVDTASRQNFVAEFETRLRRSDGAELDCALFGRFIEKSGRRLLMVVYLNITARKEAERDRQQLKNHLSNTINAMPSVMIGVDRNGCITLWNKTAEAATGLSADAVRGTPVWAAYPGLAPYQDLISASMRENQPQKVSKIRRRVAGEICYENLTIYPLAAEGVEGAVIRVDDVTETVRLEEMMMQSEKMLSVGGLAAGMAHEINNPLAGMIQTANVLANRISSGPNIPANHAAAKAAGTSVEAIEAYMKARGIFKMIGAIKDSGARVVDIVDNMLSFARQSDASKSTHNPAELLDAALKLAQTDYDLKKQYDFRNIKIIRDYQADLPMLPCESVKIQQVFLNILRNGAQAMQEKRKTDKSYLPEFVLSLSWESHSNLLCIEIQDNGPGMDASVRKRVFDPFFTTKPEGVGTGLGLSVSYFIITENHGGKLAVESAPGTGAKFIILLPLVGSP